MTEFLGDDFLLTSDLAGHLFHEVAHALPIVDVHNHLPAADIADDRRWETLTDLWLDDDHYKWRAMRLGGVPEHFITGAADPWQKFSAWAAVVPLLVGNPLYVWTHLELRRVFGIDLPLGPRTAVEIWEEANRQLSRWSAQSLLRHFRARLVATTDDPADGLDAHLRHQPAASELAIVPTFRPDRAHALLEDPVAWNEWADRLADAEGVAIGDLAGLLGSLESSFRRFAALGGRASDHGLARLPDRPRDPAAADAVIRRARRGDRTTPAQRELVMLEVVALAARLAFEDDSVLQLHLGPLRNVSPRVFAEVGRDAGADVMGDARQAPGLARFLGDLERAGTLPRTVLYNLTPADNAVFATMAGAFTRPGVPALVQWGPPWWFNDHEDGMRRQLEDLAAVGVLGTFIGMLTDSRSILSMTRHELFRRVLCDTIATAVVAGRYPRDDHMLDLLVRSVSVDNASAFFGFPSFGRSGE